MLSYVGGRFEGSGSVTGRNSGGDGLGYLHITSKTPTTPQGLITHKPPATTQQPPTTTTDHHTIKLQKQLPMSNLWANL
jgi:hypothetical protein